MVLENVTTASTKVRARFDNVAGVKIPVFEHFSSGAQGRERERERERERDKGEKCFL